MGMNINSTYLKKREWRLQPTPPYGDELLKHWIKLTPMQFQLTPPYGDERTGAFLLPLMCIISTHTPAGGWTHGEFWSSAYIFISTHTPAGGWTWFLPAFSLLTFYYNPHPRMGDEQLWSSADSDLSKFQSSPPYGDECDIIEFNKTIFTISTHIPAWGWTKGLSCKLEDLYITTHTPAWGWTKQFDKESALPNFQLTPQYGDERYTCSQLSPDA